MHHKLFFFFLNEFDANVTIFIYKLFWLYILNNECTKSFFNPDDIAYVVNLYILACSIGLLGNLLYVHITNIYFINIK